MNKNNSPNFLLKAASYRLKIHILIYYCLIFNNGISIHYHITYYESKIATSNTFLEKGIVFYFITGTRNI